MITSAGFDASTGTLYLYFKPATSITAGTPYIFKYTKAADYRPYDENRRITWDIMNPEFSGVIDNSADAIARQTVTSAEGYVSFKGTYSYMPLPDDKSILLIGSYVDKNNTSDPSDDIFHSYLYYPQSDPDYPDFLSSIGACRAYFKLNKGLTVGEGTNGVRGFNLSFGEEESQGIHDNNRETINNKHDADAWYSLSGMKLGVVGAGPVPARLRKGLYIHNGRKVVVP